MTVLLTADNLSRRFNRLSAVNHIELTLSTGQITGLLGANGSGKSTTLKMLAGVLQPNQGQVRIKGFDLYRTPLSAKHFVGYAPENPPLYPAMTVDAFLHFCALLRGLTTAQAQLAVANIKSACHLTEQSSHLLKNLSQGFQQRVNIAQALVHSPEIIILDEPTNALDPEQTEQTLTMLKKLSQNRALIVSSHRLSEIETLCTDVMVMRDGSIQGKRSLTPPACPECWRLRTRRPINLEQIKLPDKIERVTVESRQSLLLNVGQGFDPEALADCIIQAGLGLVSLQPASDSLSQWYLDITHA